jgi:hypothetical protein
MKYSYLDDLWLHGKLGFWPLRFSTSLLGAQRVWLFFLYLLDFLAFSPLTPGFVKLSKGFGY